MRNQELFGSWRQMRPPSWARGHATQGTTLMLLVAAAVFLVVVGVGAATSYLRSSPGATSPPYSEMDSATITHLKEYTRAIETAEPASAPADGKLLPDVNTMIERLAARLKTAPNDAKGWQMLGWSYFNTARYEHAAAAYARALALAPNSQDIKLAYEKAKEMASERNTSEVASSERTDSPGRSGDGPRAEDVARLPAVTSGDRDASIRSMVDGLASRLESSPRDIEGWTHLMRSRVVLGETEVATKALRKALEVFKDDATALGKLMGSAIELGLKAD